MPFIDRHAATRLTELREDAGLSQEGLARAVRLKSETEGWYKVHGSVDAFTIRAIEDFGHCPSERVRVALSLFFGVPHRELWQPAQRRPIATSLRSRIAKDRAERVRA